jgi:hypothetical protein
LFKTFKKLEGKKKSEPFFSKKLFRIVVVLFELKKGSDINDIKALVAAARADEPTFQHRLSSKGLGSTYGGLDGMTDGTFNLEGSGLGSPHASGNGIKF